MVVRRTHTLTSEIDIGVFTVLMSHLNKIRCSDEGGLDVPFVPRSKLNFGVIGWPFTKRLRSRSIQTAILRQS